MHSYNGKQSHVNVYYCDGQYKQHQKVWLRQMVSNRRVSRFE